MDYINFFFERVICPLSPHLISSLPTPFSYAWSQKNVLVITCFCFPFQVHCWPIIRPPTQTNLHDWVSKKILLTTQSGEEDGAIIWILASTKVSKRHSTFGRKTFFQGWGRKQSHGLKEDRNEDLFSCFFWVNIKINCQFRAHQWYPLFERRCGVFIQVFWVLFCCLWFWNYWSQVSLDKALCEKKVTGFGCCHLNDENNPL